MNKNKNLAFTLAEVLIVIGIIGVVAALTLPNLNHATGDKETVTKVKKIYSTLNEAFDRAQAIYGPVTEWWADGVCENGNAGAGYDWKQCSLNYLNRITEFMKVSKVDEDADPDDWYKVTLPGGTTFGTYFYGAYGHSKYVPNADYMGDISVDIDGPNKGKNQYGYDWFTFDITSQGIYPNGVDTESDEYNISQGYGQTRWILENGNLDYLKCPDELNWETKKSCE